MESLHTFRFWHLGTFFRKALKLEVGVGAGSTYLYELKNMCRWEKSGLQAVASGI